MLNKLLVTSMVFAFLVLGVKSQDLPPVSCSASETSYNLPCTKQEIAFVGQEKITVKVYTKEKPGKTINKTFVVVHADEENGLDAAKQAISENYGRLVEIVANAPSGKRKRYLYFGVNKESCVDPNRIYTKNGIKEDLGTNPCSVNNPASDGDNQIFKFGQKLLGIVTMNEKYNFIVGIHNNMNSLCLDRWSKAVAKCKTTGDIKTGEDFKTGFGIFKANNHENNSLFETNGNNFVLATNGTIFGKLLENGVYYLALQENREYLTAPGADNQRVLKGDLDDGSMSIYFGATLFKDTGNPFNYLVVEAGYVKDAPSPEAQRKNAANKEWQKNVIRKIIEMEL